MQLSSLRGRKVVERVRRRGNKWRGKAMHISYEMGAPRTRANATGVFVGSAASTKLHKSAVKRNRMRRRCREALRLSAQELQKLPTCQLIVSPGSRSLDADFSELREDAEAFFRELSRYAKKPPKA